MHDLSDSYLLYDIIVFQMTSKRRDPNLDYVPGISYSESKQHVVLARKQRQQVYRDIFNFADWLMRVVLDGPSTSHCRMQTQWPTTEEQHILEQVDVYVAEKERVVLEEVEYYQVEESNLEEEASCPPQNADNFGTSTSGTNFMYADWE